MGERVRDEQCISALGHGASNEALGNLKVAVIFVGGVELYGGGTQVFSPTQPGFHAYTGSID